MSHETLWATNHSTSKSQKLLITYSRKGPKRSQSQALRHYQTSNPLRLTLSFIALAIWRTACQELCSLRGVAGLKTGWLLQKFFKKAPKDLANPRRLSESEHLNKVFPALNAIIATTQACWLLVPPNTVQEWTCDRSRQLYLGTFVSFPCEAICCRIGSPV